MLINPTKITNYNLTHAELEAHILFWVFAAGHNAMSTARGLNKLLVEAKEAAKPTYEGDSPFGWLSISQDKRLYLLSRSGLGCWRIKSRTVSELLNSNLNLHICSVTDLEKIHGIGKKTSRCFILHSRKDVNDIACLDTHVLKYMKAHGIKVPKSTPSGKKYLELEKEFLKLAKKSNKTLAELDLAIWNRYSKAKEYSPPGNLSAVHSDPQ
jgi:hypothetical protein